MGDKTVKKLIPLDRSTETSNWYIFNIFSVVDWFDFIKDLETDIIIK